MGKVCRQFKMEPKTITQYEIEAKKATIFSSATFCKIWAEVYALQWHRVGSKGDLGVVYKPYSIFSLRKYELSPYGLYWGSKEMDSHLSKPFIALVSELCRKWNCLSLTWNFRYDAHDELELALARLGSSNCTVTQHHTHVLDLNEENFEQLLHRRMKPVTRQQINYGIKSGLTIRKICTPHDLDQHEAIYLAWVTAKNIKPRPLSLFRRLAVEMGQSASLLGAFLGEKLIAAILVFRDDQEWFYWHGVRDPNYDKKFATDVLLHYLTQEAFKCKSYYLNMGGSGGIKSLEFFKERWGAEKRPVWCLQWNNPFWVRAGILKRLMELVRKIS
jgi:hypothetical protein